MTVQRKFIVQHLRDTTTIHEVDCEEVFCDPWEILPGEKKYRVLSGNDHSILMSWAIYDSSALALNAAAGDLRTSMRTNFNEQELTKQVANIVIKRLEK
jgi:hypothetical protein